uniref:Outer dynein arm-docking complex subunit 4 n=1 Tax=Fundulus heteroclitus TaxID=8078 RepID=A0A3Q2PDP8_FUNHE
MARKNEYSEEEILKNKVSSLRADGEWKLRKGNYKQALSSFDAALDLAPTDKKCFVARSKCYMRMGQFKNALMDAEASLKEDASYPEALSQKADALYYMGEFEFALVFNHRGQKIRPQMEGFKIGIQKAEEAITNSVGNPSSAKLEVKGDLSFLKEEEERVQPIAVVQNLTKKAKRQTPEALKNEKTTKQLLGEFYLHKKFLEKLLQDEDLAKGVTKSGERVEDIIQSSITSLDNCADLWSQEKPVSLKDRKRQPKQQKSDAPSDKVQFLLRSLEEIDGELTSGNAKGSLKKAEEIMKTVQGWSKKDCPVKEEMICFLHSCIGNASFDLGDMDKALQQHHKDLELAKQCTFLEATSRALGNIGRTHAETGQFAKALEFWEEKIPLVHEGLEKVWLLHDIGCCQLELGRAEKARDYGLRSVAAAEEMFDDTWQLRARVLLGHAELNLGNFESSASHFEKALSLAKLLNDDTALSAIQQALDEAKEHLQH